MIFTYLELRSELISVSVGLIRLYAERFQLTVTDVDA